MNALDAAVGALRAATAPETPTAELQLWDVSPGIAGFWAFFLLVAAVVVLGFFVVRQMRRVDQNARLRAARESAAADDDARTVPPDAGDGGQVGAGPAR